MPSVGAVLGKFAEHLRIKEQFKTFQEKVKQYVLREFHNQRDIIIVVRDLKDPYAQVDMDKPIKLNKEYTEDIIHITQLQDEEKYYVKRV